MLKSAASFAAMALRAALKQKSSGGSAFRTVATSVLRTPVKAVAAFICAPFLALRVALAAKNPVRRAIAGAGLFIAVMAAWFAGTFLGTLAGAALVAAKLGLFWGFAFLISTSISVVLSVTFSLLVLNATALFFLHMSSEEVVQYLQALSE